MNRRFFFGSIGAAFASVALATKLAKTELLIVEEATSETYLARYTYKVVNLGFAIPEEDVNESLYSDLSSDLIHGLERVFERKSTRMDHEQRLNRYGIVRRWQT